MIGLFRNIAECVSEILMKTGQYLIQL